MDDRLLASDLLHDVRNQCQIYNLAALDASDDELKKSFLGFHDAEMHLHTEVYNFLKNQGWYLQQAGDLTASGGFRGEFWPHGRGERMPLDRPDHAYGKSTWETHNTPRLGRDYSQEYERQIRDDMPYRTQPQDAHGQARDDAEHRNRNQGGNQNPRGPYTEDRFVRPYAWQEDRHR